MREPHNVCVFPFRITAQGPRYAVFKRADDGSWQGVSGGVEEGEDLVTAARREAEEEAGITDHHPIYKLDMISGVGKEDFAASRFWSRSLYIVFKHFFAMDVSAGTSRLSISAEHDEVRWASYAEAYETLRYDDDKNALWEVDTRLRNKDLPEAATLADRQVQAPGVIAT